MLYLGNCRTGREGFLTAISGINRAHLSHDLLIKLLMTGIIQSVYQLRLLSIRFTLPYRLPLRLEWTSPGQESESTSDIYRLSGLKAVTDETLTLRLPEGTLTSTVQLYGIASKPAPPRLIGSLEVNLQEVQSGGYSKEKEYEVRGGGRSIFLSFELIHVPAPPSLLDETLKKQSSEQECGKVELLEQVEAIKKQLVCALETLSEATKQNDFLVGELNLKQDENLKQILKIRQLQKLNESLKDNNKELAKVANSKKDTALNQRQIAGKLMQLKMINTELELKISCLEDKLSNADKERESICLEYERRLGVQNSDMIRKHTEQVQKLVKGVQESEKQRNKLVQRLDEKTHVIQLLEAEIKREIQKAKEEKGKQITRREWEQLRNEYSQWKAKEQELTLKFEQELWRFQEMEEMLKEHLDELELQINEYEQKSEANQKEEVRLREENEHLKIQVESLMIYKAHYQRLVATKFTSNGNSQHGGQSEDKSILLDLLGKTTKKMLILQEQNKFNLQSLMKFNADANEMDEMREENRVLRDKINGLHQENKTLIYNNSRLGKEINTLTREAIKLKDQQRWNQLTHKISQQNPEPDLQFTFNATQKPINLIFDQIKRILQNRETQVGRLAEINLRSTTVVQYDSLIQKLTAAQTEVSLCKMAVIHKSTLDQIPIYTNIFNNCLQSLEAALADVALLMKRFDEMKRNDVM